jgi:immune inhibitor A
MGPIRCLVAPSPELQARIRAGMRDVQGSGAVPPGQRVLFVPQSRPGFDDGLIVPGNLFPLGTSERVVRSAAADRAPLRGTVRVIVVLVDFSDQAMARPLQAFRDLFFSTGVIPTGSVREYFTEVTHGLIDLTGDVVGPLRLSRTMVQYANGESGTGTAAPNAQTMAREAAELANPLVNFAPFDNDGNGFVDAFIVIHAGPGAEVTGNGNHIWSHKWVLSGGAFNADGTSIFAYLTVPEDSRIGVCAHELGHLLFGWPDLYDTDSSSEGLGNWCLMAGGSWNSGGDVPAHPSAWCKANQGWASVQTHTANAVVSIPDVKTSHTVHRLWKDGGPGNEYFLVENRQRTGFDAHLPGDGLHVYHVDEAITTNANENHPKVKLMEADGLAHLHNGANRGDAGDVYPGSSGNTTFNSTSNPNSKSYGNVDTCVSVTNISAAGPTMSARFGVRCVAKLSKELIKEKEFKEGKELRKEFRKEIIKEKDFKEKDFKEKDFKELKEKDIFEKPGDGRPGLPGGGRTPGGGGEGTSPVDALSRRVDALEQFARTVEPFIGSSLRPDVASGAVEGEDDLSDIVSQMQQGSAFAKRSYDTKPSDV